MIPLDVLLLFTAASAALAIAPGPDNIFVLTQSALHGRKAGLVTTLGLCTGLWVHISAVALGVAALIQASVVAFTVLKVVGALYLLYLAWQSFRAGRSDLSQPAAPALGLRKLYLRGILMNVTNPKVAIFFLAFLPQFADPARGAVAGQIVVLGLVFMLVALGVFAAIAWTAGYMGAWLRRSSTAQLAIQRVAGTVFALLALRLVLTKP